MSTEYVTKTINVNNEILTFLSAYCQFVSTPQQPDIHTSLTSCALYKELSSEMACMLCFI